jgi:hypothetical protein
VHVFKRHFPYHESDHILNLAYNVLCGGTRLEDLERLRSNEAYLNTLGCERVPDPTTAGDFLRRFDEDQVMELMEATNAARVKVWKKLSKQERALALIDVDGTIAPTTGECKEGMDISYKGIWCESASNFDPRYSTLKYMKPKKNLPVTGVSIGVQL